MTTLVLFAVAVFSANLPDSFLARFLGGAVALAVFPAGLITDRIFPGHPNELVLLVLIPLSLLLYFLVGFACLWLFDIMKRRRNARSGT
jgi:hypothetical protein